MVTKTKINNKEYMIVVQQQPIHIHDANYRKLTSNARGLASLNIETLKQRRPILVTPTPTHFASQAVTTNVENQGS
jgi:hypothetical protein